MPAQVQFHKHTRIAILLFLGKLAFDTICTRWRENSGDITISADVQKPLVTPSSFEQLSGLTNIPLCPITPPLPSSPDGVLKLQPGAPGKFPTSLTLIY
ncbi:hypothetical protein BaRGS_00004760 [Batillaria attramentaria]|uniref:Uncharacterized protein n=1 Tax=Batillaria attramentaria TaxID=370345 RepID=A0ABD0LY53_9CAEN